MSDLTKTPIRFYHSTFMRLALVVALAASVLAGAVSELNHLSAREGALRQLRGQAVVTSHILAAQLTSDLRFNGAAQIEAVFKGFVDDRGTPATGALALSAKGDTLTSYLPEGGSLAPLQELGKEALASKTATLSADGLTVAIPVQAQPGSPVFGVVITQWSADQTMAEIAAASWRVLAMAGVVLGAVLVAVIALFRRLLSLPLVRVERAMAAVAAGQLETEVPETRRRDEIGGIARALEAFRAQLAASEQSVREGLFRGSAFESASSCMMLLDTDLQITAVNGALLDMLHKKLADFRAFAPGFEPSALVGRSFAEFHPQGHPAHAMMSAEAMPLNAELRIGQGFYSIAVSAVHGAKRDLIGYSVEWVDVTAAKSNAVVIEAIDATQLRADFLPDGHLTHANQALCAVLGRTFDALAGRDFSAALTEPETGASCFAAVASGESIIGQMALRCEGGLHLINGTLAPVRNGKGELQRIILIATDVTEIEAREARNRTEREQAAASQRQVVDDLRAALKHLAEGDLSRAISQAFPEEYETLRQDYNQATVRLREAMQTVLENSDSIRAESGNISRAAEDLSRRTEQQAATLEETAAALNQLTASVESAAERTQQANALVGAARSNAESSGKVVHEAVQAMGEISESSNKISRITSVIEEISFQTNLLALNAGVEAARAGEAGRGFAVVASEVRALAQRSSDAAREIAALISASSDQVKRGVDLVGQAGNALGGIQASVDEIVGFMTEIAASTTEQSAGLSEVNAAVLQLDQVTQHNAAMFEQTSAASQSLVREADGLSETMARFRLDEGVAPPENGTAFHTRRSASAEIYSMPERAGTEEELWRDQPVPAPALTAPRLSALAVKPLPAEDDWEDF